MSLSIVYLLEDTPMFGGVKVLLQQANLLTDRGHRVRVVTPGASPDWFPLRAELVRTPGLDPKDIPEADVVVAGYWTTIPRALAGASGEVVHYCQGFEGIYTHNREEHSAIEEAYRAKIPAMAVSEHLAEMLRERFGRPARVVPQPLDETMKPGFLPRFRPRRRPRILVTSPFEIDWKGVPTSLRAVKKLREQGVDCELIRLSQWPLSDEEKALVEPDEFHEHIPPEEVPKLIRSCDLLLAASWEQEGFGLPVLEAMACGVPVVASDIACFRGFAGDAARLVAYDDPDAFAAAAREVLGDASLWRRLRSAGQRIAERYTAENSGRVAEEVMRWTASGAWREELVSPPTSESP